MSMTAAEIKTECANRIDRPDDVSDDQIYNWMNRAKRRVQTDGEPLDFMLHRAFLVSGSGTARVGVDSTYEAGRILLPYNYVSMAEFKISNKPIPGPDMDDLYGNNSLPLYYGVSTGSQGDGLTSEHSGADIMPYFAENIGFLFEEFGDRSLSYDLDEALDTFLTGRAISDVGGRSAVREGSADFTYHVYGGGGNRWASITESAISSTHALGAWQSKVLDVSPEDLDGVIDIGDDYGYLALATYYRWLPDYNEPNPESLLGFLPASYVTEDIFTRRHEELLIYGTLWHAHEYLDNVREAMRYREMFNEESRRCRSHHLRSQVRPQRTRKRIKRGTKVSGEGLI